MTKQLLVAIAAMTICASSWAGRSLEQTLSTPRSMADRFLVRVGKGEISEAYDEIFSGSAMSTLKPQALEMVKRQTQAGLPVYGKPLGFELHDEKIFGESLVRLIYIQRLEQHPIVWRFWFYRPAEKWFLDNVAFNDQFMFL